HHLQAESPFMKGSAGEGVGQGSGPNRTILAILGVGESRCLEMGKGLRLRGYTERSIGCAGDGGHARSVEPDAVGGEERARAGAAVDARVAGDERAGRLRLGNGGGGGDAALPRVAGGGAVGPPGPRDDAEPPVRAAAAAERDHGTAGGRGAGPAGEGGRERGDWR